MADFTDTKQLAQKSKLVWMDLEMTGLNPFEDGIIEIAVLITDSRLKIVATGPSLIIHQPQSMINKMDRSNPVINKFFIEGLIDKVKDSYISTKAAESKVLQFLQRHLKKDEAPLCGKSVYIDRIFLLHYMPKVADYLHHKDIDVSTIKEFYQRWFPKPVPFKKRPTHRAMEDILESIEELKYYRSELIKK